MNCLSQNGNGLGILPRKTLAGPAQPIRVARPEAVDLEGINPHISPVSATVSQVLPWLRYVSARDPQRVKNTSAVTDLTCLATKGLGTPRDETGETSRLTNLLIDQLRNEPVCQHGHFLRQRGPRVAATLLDDQFGWYAFGLERGKHGLRLLQGDQLISVAMNQQEGRRCGRDEPGR